MAVTASANLLRVKRHSGYTSKRTFAKSEDSQLTCAFTFKTLLHYITLLNGNQPMASQVDRKLGQWAG